MNNIEKAVSLINCEYREFIINEVAMLNEKLSLEVAGKNRERRILGLTRDVAEWEMCKNVTMPASSNSSVECGALVSLHTKGLLTASPRQIVTTAKAILNG